MPNRIIKESICTSEKIAALSDFEFRLWVGLITQADDAGRGDARPAIIKGHVFPLRDQVTAKAISAGLHALATVQLVSLYTVGGKPIYWLPGWSEHQRIRDCKPKYPAPEEADNIPPQTAADGGNSPQTAADGGSRGRESESESNPNPNPEECAHARRARGQYGWVKLSDDEYSRLIADLGDKEAARCIAYVDESAQGTGNKNRWKDWNLVVRKCSREGWGLDSKRANSTRSASAPKDYTCLNVSLSQLDKLIDEI